MHRPARNPMGEILVIMIKILGDILRYLRYFDDTVTAVLAVDCGRLRYFAVIAVHCGTLL